MKHMKAANTYYKKSIRGKKERLVEKPKFNFFLNHFETIIIESH